MQEKSVSIRFPEKELAVIRKAAKLDRRSMNQFITLACYEAAKARVAIEKIRPSSAVSEEVSA